VKRLFAGLVALAASSAAAAPGPFHVQGPARSDVDQPTPTSVETIVPVEGPIQDLDVLVYLLSGHSDNLRLTLVHDGTSVVLYEGTGDSPASLVAVFDDEAAFAAPTSGIVDGFYRPAPGTLAAFDGHELSGRWELRIENVTGAPGDGTDLTRFELAGRIGYAGPPAVVALYDDPGFVDTADLSGHSEAENVRAALERSGHDVRGFGGLGADRFADALAEADVLVVPELDADLAGALAPAPEQVVRDFVAEGGRVVVLSGSPYADDFLNAVLGTTVAISDEDANTSLAPGAIGTPFQGGPGQLPYFDQVGKIETLPDGARVAYANGGAIYSVALIPYLSGEAVFLGFDYDDAAPLGSRDGGWLELLDRAVLGRRALPTARRVAVYDDPAYVDTAASLEEFAREADTVQASLAALGHDVSRFDGTSAAAFAAATAGAQVLLLPELETGDLAAALGEAAEAVVEGFVAGGGVLIVHGEYEGRGMSVLNEVFGWALAPGDTQESEEANPLIANPAAGTRFAGGVSFVPGNDATTIVTGAPLGVQAVYQDAGFQTVVARIPHGLGQVIHLGWDWYDAAPLGSRDGGWLEVLNRAVLEAPEPGATSLALAAVASLAGLARARSRT
jgi:hypothetical protein